jgi:chemotaxis protein CheD
MSDKMFNNSEKYFLHPGYIFISRNPYLIHTVLGSCVAVCLWDSVQKYGGMNHFIYARSKPGERNCKYGDISIPHMINLMIFNGSSRAGLKAHITGGGFQADLGPEIGEENYEVAKEILQKNEIEIITTDVGGQTGRKVIFDSGSGRIIVYKGINIRQDDWYNRYEK